MSLSRVDGRRAGGSIRRTYGHLAAGGVRYGNKKKGGPDGPAPFVMRRLSPESLYHLPLALQPPRLTLPVTAHVRVVAPVLALTSENATAPASRSEATTMV